PLLVLTDDSKWPLPLGIMQFQGQYGWDWAGIMAYVMLLIIPAVIFYIVTEKYIVTGLTGGELKGQSMYGLFGKMRAQPGQREALLAHPLPAASQLNDLASCYLYVIRIDPDHAD